MKKISIKFEVIGLFKAISFFAFFTFVLSLVGIISLIIFDDNSNISLLHSKEIFLRLIEAAKRLWLFFLIWFLLALSYIVFFKIKKIPPL